MSEFHFLRPLWFIALALLPLFWFIWRRAHADAGAWQRVVDAHLLSHLLEPGADRVQRTPFFLTISGWCLAVFALAGPAWERVPVSLYKDQAARLFALQLSPTMLAQDIKPSRLDRARYKMIDALERSRGGQTALIAYAGDAFVAAPLTDDINTVRNLLDALEPSVMPRQGNAMETAINKAVGLLHQAGLKQGELVIFADSANLQATAAAQAAYAQGLSVSILGIGTQTGAPVALDQGDFLKDANGNIVLPKIDDSALNAVAVAGGGKYQRLTPDNADLNVLLGAVPISISNSKIPGKAQTERYIDRGPWLVLLLLPLALLGFRRGWLMGFVFIFIMPVPHAQAIALPDLWLRPDQQAAAALSAGDAKRAAELAQDPVLQATASYRAGDYAAAEQAYAKSTTPDAAYGQGNALAKLGRYDEAIAAYERALQLDPAMEDAQVNKKAVEDWLKQQAEQKNQSSSAEQNSQQQENSEQQQDASSSQNNEQQKSESSQQGTDSTAQQSNETAQQQSKDAQSDAENQTQQDMNKQSQDQANEVKNATALDEKSQNEQQQALSQQVDQALKNDEQDEKNTPSKIVINPQDEAMNEQQQAQMQWLERIPDDPSGLLRRKFLLEYQRQQQGGQKR